MSTYIVKSLDQAKLLTDPFKAKLLERFAGNPATTKQVADLMGEKAPRLYRHVDALFEAGLLELVQEKPKRGTVERYFRTIASRFEVDPHLFSKSHGKNNESVDMMNAFKSVAYGTRGKGDEWSNFFPIISRKLLLREEQDEVT